MSSGYSRPDPQESRRADGPTIEEYVKAGYLAHNYPPRGYAERPSPALDAYRLWRDNPHDAALHQHAADLLGVSVGEVTHGKVEIAAGAATPLDTVREAEAALPAAAEATTETVADLGLPAVVHDAPIDALLPPAADRRENDAVVLTDDERQALTDTETLAGVDERREHEKE